MDLLRKAELWRDGMGLRVQIPHPCTNACPCLGLQCLPLHENGHTEEIFRGPSRNGLGGPELEGCGKGSLRGIQ